MSSNTVLFNVSKNEMFKLSDNYKALHRKLKNNYKIEQNKGEIHPDLLKYVKLFVLAAPQEKFTEDEFKCLKEYVNNGGNLMVFLGEGGETDFNTNINFLLEDYGMNINNDSVVRPHYYKYFHPKEALINGGIANDDMCKVLLENNKNSSSAAELLDEKFTVEFVYPFGSTINVVHPSAVLLTTGPVAYPLNRPIVGYYNNEKNGKIIAVGSGHMFQDKYIANESNMAIWDYFLHIIMDTNFKLISSDLNDLEIQDYAIVPDTIYLAEQPKICLMETLDYDIPVDFKKMFDITLYSINNNLLRDVINTYEKLNVQYEPLKIIKPQFEIPYYLQLAVFPPIFSDLPAPALELFDLDEAFSSERAQITQLTNKCLMTDNSDVMSDRYVDEKELEYYVQECGRILNISQDDHNMTAKEIINAISVKIAHYKKVDRDQYN